MLSAGLIINNNTSSLSFLNGELNQTNTQALKYTQQPVAFSRADKIIHIISKWLVEQKTNANSKPH